MIEYIVQSNGTLTNLGQCAKDAVKSFIEDFLSMFYIMSPIETTQDNAYDVPDYEVKLLPMIATLLIIELICRYFQQKDYPRFQDLVINSGSAIIFTLMRVFLLTTSVYFFALLYNEYRILDLPLHSVWTWLFSLLLVEFTYYWTHRALHELNFLWAAHQFHHMAEDVNITTTVRDSVVDLFIYAFFPIPLALLVPPQVLMVHVQFSLIYQVWLHNSVVGNLGFIEYIINTPRQHRVHHGKNPYCIDKNYGALIMIWDRMFGTYQTEKEKIYFGVVSPTPKTFDSMSLQFGYYRDVWQKFNKVEGFGNKMSALFKGPGWQPGKPRLGNISDVPEPDPTLPKYSYDPFIPDWKKVYIAFHSIVIVIGFYILADHPYIRYSPMKGLIVIFYIIFLLTAFGAIFDDRKHQAILEILRCLTYIPFDYYLIESYEWPIGKTQYIMLQMMLWIVRVGHILSILFWIAFAIAQNKAKPSAEKSTDYTVVSKDVESETSSVLRRTAYKTVFVIFSLLVLAFPFGIGFLLRLESCVRMFNDWNYLFE